MNNLGVFFLSIKKRFSENWQICFILLIAAIVRFYKLTEIPFHHDELSALLRTKFSSFSELIAKGVKIDGHPALVQSFLYFWTKLFGYTEWIVKLPFILLSIGSVYLIYKIGTKWYNVTAGLLLAALFTFSEYTLTHGAMIRPYGSGLFFTLLMTYHWGELVFFRSKRLKHYTWYILGAVLCSYNHHFSLLMAALIGLSGLFIVDKSLRWKYILASFFIPLLYLPHLSIFLYQLHVGGIESWLGKPSPDFIWSYLSYIFHYSWWTLIIFLLIIGWNAFSTSYFRICISKFQVVSLFLFIINYAIGYFYSVYGAAVLQKSVLIFSYPFLLLFLVGFVKDQKTMKRNLSIAALLIVFGTTLIVNRQFFKLFYVPTFKQMVLDANEFNQAHKCTTLFFSDEPKTRFYEPQLNIPKSYQFVEVPAFTFKELNVLLINAQKKSNYFCLASTAGIPPQFKTLILQYFPTIIETRNYFSASTFLFENTPSNEYAFAELSAKKDKHWRGIVEGRYSSNTYAFEQNEEWGPTYQRPFSELVKNPNDFIDIVAILKTNSPSQTVGLVLSGETADTTFMYQSMNTTDSYWNPADSTVTIVQSLKLIDTPYRTFENPTFTAFLWNVSKEKSTIKSFKLYYRKGNPYTYGLFEPID